MASTLGGKVSGSEGKEYDTRLVLPVPLESTPVQTILGGGNKVRDENRRESTSEYRHDLIKLLGAGGPTFGQPSCAGPTPRPTSEQPRRGRPTSGPAFDIAKSYFPITFLPKKSALNVEKHRL